MNLMRTYLYFWITASVALYVSAFAAMALPVNPHCCADASPARADGSHEHDLTLAFVAPEGTPMHGVYVEVYDQQHRLVLQTDTNDAVLVTRLPAGTYTGTAKHAQQRVAFSTILQAGNDGKTLVTFGI